MFASTADELLKFFRTEVSDDADPPLWSDWEAYGYMTEAFDAVLKGTNAVQKVLILAYPAEAAGIPIPHSVTHINMVTLVGRGVLYERGIDGSTAHNDDYGVSSPAMDAFAQGRVGTPGSYVRDYRTKQLMLVPRPAVDCQLEIQCATTLGIPMDAGAPLPTTDAEDLRLVLHYMKYLAYQKHDAETEDLVRSKTHLSLYASGVQAREVALRNYRSPPVIVRGDY